MMFKGITAKCLISNGVGIAVASWRRTCEISGKSGEFANDVVKYCQTVVCLIYKYLISSPYVFILNSCTDVNMPGAMKKFPP